MDRLTTLREAMKRHEIDAYIMVNCDPHESEYLPDHWKSVRWITGFRGEVATVIVTHDEALLWTDSRFFISGEQQLQGTGIKLMKMKIDMTATDWMKEKLKAGNGDWKIGADLKILFGPLAEFVNTDTDLMEEIWTDRPEMPLDKVEIYADEYNGESAEEKIGRTLKAIEEQAAEGQETSLLISALDEIAWMLNLRGNDIHCTPVFTSYLLLSAKERILYVDDRKLTDEVVKYLENLNIVTQPYEEGLKLAKEHKNTVKNPIPLMKGIKNQVEIDGFRNAMLKDGIAMTQFYHWLETELPSGKITEMQCVGKLREYRERQPLYKDESFDAIVAWNEHGALPHYEPTEETDVEIKGDGLLLIDTGGHYLDGTTDITRTIGVGNVSKAMKRDYTLVLKGHIRLAQAVFPEGTRGDQLDALARMDLWRDGKTYRHGTSHGVGHYLGVHEGPESVRMEHNPQQLLPGMFFSNEPAIYLGGKYGIRHENCVLVREFDPQTEAPEASPCCQEEHGRFLCLETLTLCYIDTRCIDINLMDRNEIDWVNRYNRHVCNCLTPHLDADDANWLAAKCKEI